MAKQRTIVGSPLTPALLKELGAFETLPSTPGDFKPDGEWINTYRIWTCHGYRESGNQNVGFLRIERVHDSNQTFKLNVHQEILQTDAMVGAIDATTTCRSDPSASPIRWSLMSQLLGADGEPIPESLCTHGGVPSKWTEGITGDWCLFEAVQRLSPDMQTSLSFDLLEGMGLRKSNHRLSYGGLIPTSLGAGETPLHRFVQFGSGILPTEYWLDTRHRLFVVTSMNKAYILDDRAENSFKQDVERARKSYLKKNAPRK